MVKESYFLDKFGGAFKKMIEESQETAKKDFGLFLDDISEINPLLKNLIDKSRIKWKV